MQRVDCHYSIYRWSQDSSLGKMSLLIVAVATPAALRESDVLDWRILFPWGGIMLWTIFAILMMLSVLGFGYHMAANVIYFLLAAAGVVLLLNYLEYRRRAV